jgi:hypothetical protein
MPLIRRLLQNKLDTLRLTLHRTAPFLDVATHTRTLLIIQTPSVSSKRLPPKQAKLSMVAVLPQNWYVG